jgi:hypothetical protein
MVLNCTNKEKQAKAWDFDSSCMALIKHPRILQVI